MRCRMNAFVSRQLSRLLAVHVFLVTCARVRPRENGKIANARALNW